MSGAPRAPEGDEPGRLGLPTRTAETARRLHPVSVVFSTLRAVQGFAPLVLIALLFPGRGEAGPSLSLLWFIVPLSLAEGLGNWLRSRYSIEQGELRFVRGFLLRRRVFIPRARIQAVDVSAGPLQRLFGVVRVDNKTAAAGTQVELSAVSRAEAARLQRELAPKPAEKRSQAPSGFTVTWRSLLLAAGTSGQLGLVLGAVFWVYSQLEQVLGEELIEWILPRAGSVAGADPLAIGTLVAAALLVSWLVSIGAHLLRFGGFSVGRVEDRLVVKRGILERRETAIGVDRVQAVRFVENLPRQVLGYGVVYVDSAGHAEEKGRSTVLHPLLPRSEWQAFLAALLPGFTVLEPELRPPRRALRRFVVRPAWRVLLVSGIAGWIFPGGLWVLALTPAALLVGLLAFRFASAAAVGGDLTLRFGALQRSTVALRRRGLQSVGSDASILQRRLRLATFHVAIASGAGGRTLSVPDLEQEQVLGLLDWSRPSGRAPRDEPGASAPRVPAADEAAGELEMHRQERHAQ